jgi:hypothetical protein
VNKIRFFLIGVFIGRVVFLPVVMFLSLCLLVATGLLYLVQEVIPWLLSGIVSHLAYPWSLWGYMKKHPEVKQHFMKVSARQSWPSMFKDMAISWFTERGAK